jgi:4'-phosphopantetheinyl transferase
MSLDEPAGAGNRSELVALPSPCAGVAVWMCELARPADEIHALAATLSPAEHARAARFGRPELRDRYVVGRATLRILLGRRLGVPPHDVEIRRGIRGRPHVADGGTLDFNVSHTDAVALFGFTMDGLIGVDLEHGERQLNNVDGIARKFMAPDEQSALAHLAPDQRHRALLRLWTCKEAMSKATGDAMSAPFRRMSIAVDELRLEAGPPPYTPGAWRLLPIAVAGGYLATVALWHGVAPPAA